MDLKLGWATSGNQASCSMGLLKLRSDKNNEHQKITYKVDVKTRLEAVSLQATWMSLHTRCESRNVASIASIASLYEVENIELFRQHRMTLCRDSRSALRFSPALMSWRQERSCNLLNTHWIRHGGWNSYCCLWILRSSDNTTLYTKGLFYELRHDVLKFSNLSWTSTTEIVQKWWLCLP